MLRKLLVILFIIGCGYSLAHAAVTTATFGDQNSNKQYRMSADSDGVITMASDTTLTGGTIASVTSVTTTGNVGVGASTPTKALQVGSPTVGGTLPASSAAIAGSVEVDTDIYVDRGIYVNTGKTGYAACFMSNSGKVVIGYCSTTPTNGACTCLGL